MLCPPVVRASHIYTLVLSPQTKPHKAYKAFRSCISFPFRPVLCIDIMYSHWIFAACTTPRPAAGYVDLCQEWWYRSRQRFCVVKAKDGYENQVQSWWSKVCWELWVLCYPEKFVRMRCNLMRLGYRQWNVFRLAIFSVSVFYNDLWEYGA